MAGNVTPDVVMDVPSPFPGPKMTCECICGVYTQDCNEVERFKFTVHWPLDRRVEGLGPEELNLYVENYVYSQAILVANEYKKYFPGCMLSLHEIKPILPDHIPEF